MDTRKTAVVRAHAKMLRSAQRSPPLEAAPYLFAGRSALIDTDALFNSFKGALAEQFVAQEMLAHGQTGNDLDSGNRLHYFMNPSTRTEIDFIVDGNNQAPQPVPIEVISGVNLKAKSLTSFVKKYHPLLAIRTSLAHPSQDGVIEDVPLYAFGSYFRKNITGWQ